MRELTLPEWAFLDAHSHLGNLLKNRTVLLHIRSATVLEIFDKKDVVLNENTLRVPFKNSATGEELAAALHYSATLDVVSDLRSLKELLEKCAAFYCDYCDWEDVNLSPPEIPESKFRVKEVDGVLHIERLVFPRFRGGYINRCVGRF